MEHNHPQGDKQWKKAIETGNWKYLIPYPCMLFYWQMTHQSELIRIATLSSHRLGNHKWCDTSSKCKDIQEFYDKWNIIEQIDTVDKQQNLL